MSKPPSRTASTQPPFSTASGAGTARAPVFLNRHSYRRRRMRDASRLLPFVGLVLILLPLGWPAAPTGGGMKVGAYLFAVWAGLVLAAWVLSPRLRDWADGDDDT